MSASLPSSPVYHLVLYFFEKLKKKLLSSVDNPGVFTIGFSTEAELYPRMLILYSGNQWVVEMRKRSIALSKHLPNALHPSGYSELACWELRLNPADYEEDALNSNLADCILGEDSFEEPAITDSAQPSTTDGIPAAMSEYSRTWANGVTVVMSRGTIYMHRTDAFNKIPLSIYLLEYREVISRLIYDNEPGYIWCAHHQEPVRYSGLGPSPTALSQLESYILN